MTNNINEDSRQIAEILSGYDGIAVMGSDNDIRMICSGDTQQCAEFIYGFICKNKKDDTEMYRTLLNTIANVVYNLIANNVESDLFEQLINEAKTASKSSGWVNEMLKKNLEE